MGVFPLISLVLFQLSHSTWQMKIKMPTNIKNGTSCNPSRFYKYDECMSNGEIRHFRCESRRRRYVVKWVHNEDKDQLCFGTKSKCLCEREVWDFFDNYLCRCVDATHHPNFPSTGILKWNEEVAFKKDEDYSTVWDFFDNYLCRCVDATHHPNFPTTGILKWKEEVAFKKDEDYSTVRVKTEHEIHQNANGYYLRKYPDYNWNSGYLPWEYKFEIYVPIKPGSLKKVKRVLSAFDGFYIPLLSWCLTRQKLHVETVANYNWNSGYLPWEYKFEIYVPSKPGKLKKITGTMEDKICEVDFVKHGGSSFDTLWHEKNLHTLKKKVKKNNTITTFEWERHFDKDFAINYRYWWRMDYDSNKNVAIPVSYRHYYENWFFEGYKDIRREFEYTEVSDSKVSFDVKDYCKNKV